MSFITDSKHSTPPVVERLASDAQILRKGEVISLMADVAASAWNRVKANFPDGNCLAPYCNGN